MFRKMLILAGVIWGVMCSGQTTIPGGNVSGIWDLSGSPYLVVGNITLTYTDSLIIEPGVDVIFEGNYWFMINGVLSAEGTEEDSIRFLPGEGVDYWWGLDLSGSSCDSSRLSFCLITGSNNHGIQCCYSSPSITYCTITGNSADFGGGISCYYSNPSITHCTISGNSVTFTGGGIDCYNSNPSITHCTISDNATFVHGGGILCSNNSNLNISNCTISGNWANDNGGGIYYYSDTHLSVTNRTISRNSADFGGGIYCSNNSNMNISNCTISGNWANDNGGGIYCYSSNPSIVNTIVEGNLGGGGIYFSGDFLNTVVIYGDFCNNAGGDFTGPSVPDWLGQIVTVNLNGDSCDPFFNIFEDPLFIDPSGGDYHLLADSPCIDAGDLNGPLDPDSTIADIGAFYFDQSLGIASKPKPDLPTRLAVTGVYPNPFNPAAVIRFDLPQAAKVRLDVYDVNGRNVWAQHAAPLRDTRYLSGSHEITFDGTGLPSGVYFYRLTAGDFTATGRMVLMK